MFVKIICCSIIYSFRLLALFYTLPKIRIFGQLKFFGGLLVKVEAEEVLPRRLEGRIKDLSRLATG